MTTKLNWTLTIYNLIGWNESQNFVVDSLESYLSTLTPAATLTNFAPFTPALNMTIRISQSEKIAALLKGLSYIKAQAYDATAVLGTPYYFYVESIYRNANEVLTLTLKMDTLNTYHTPFITAFSEKTMISRMHKDRFVRHDFAGAWPRSFSLSNIIDKVSEGISPLKRVDSEKTIEGMDYTRGQNYYLIYQTKNELSANDLSNPVSCYLVADSEMLISQGQTQPIKTLTASDFDENYFYYLSDVDNPSGVVSFTTYQITLDNYRADIDGYVVCIVIYKTGTSLNITFYYVDDLSSSIWKSWTTIVTASSITLTSIKSGRRLSVATNQRSTIQNGTLVNYASGAVANVYSLAFSDVPRTDSKIMKIIKCPYSPMPVSTSANLYSVNGFSFDFSRHMFLLSNISQEFSNSRLEAEYLNDVLITAGASISSRQDCLETSRGYLPDPKKFHSDFFTFKINYDTFNTTISFEDCAIEDGIAAPYIQPTFKVTNTINSNFAIKITPYGFTWKKTIDYQDFILSSRNNEMTIFSNSYIDYIKTGYNYDKKSKAISAAANWTSTGLSIAGGLAGAILGKDPVTKATGVGLAVSGFAQLSQSIFSTIQNENTMAEKLAQLKAQSTTTAGVDDIDLLSFYGDNKARISRWAPSDQVAGMIQSLFYYYGYGCDYQGLPNVSSRAWFNYLQCQPVFVSNSLFIEMAKTEEVEDIKQKLISGVTFIHAQLIGSTYAWGFAQDKENWETWLIA